MRGWMFWSSRGGPGVGLSTRMDSGGQGAQKYPVLQGLRVGCGCVVLSWVLVAIVLLIIGAGRAYG